MKIIKVSLLSDTGALGFAAFCFDRSLDFTMWNGSAVFFTIVDTGDGMLNAINLACKVNMGTIDEIIEQPDEASSHPTSPSQQ